MDIPTHPEADEPPGPSASRRTTVVAVVMLGLLAIVVILHVAGVVGPGGG